MIEQIVYHKEKLILLVIVSMLILSGCTKKNNLTGTNWSDIRPQTATAVLESSFSYAPDSTAVVSGTESFLLCGTDLGKEATALLNFTGLPTSIDTIVVEPVLKLYATSRSNNYGMPLELSFYKILCNWEKNETSAISDDSLSILNNVTYTIPNTLSSEGDTLRIPIPKSVIANWHIDNVDGFNLAVKIKENNTSINNTWVKFSSNETVYGAKLIFKYRNGSDVDSTYSKTVYKDSYRVVGDSYQTTPDVIYIQNINPSRSYVKFNMADSLFKDSDGNVLTESVRKRLTINKAELVFHVKNVQYYSSSQKYSLYAMALKNAVDSPTILHNYQMDAVSLLNTISNYYIVGDSVTMNITAIIQAFISGKLVNNGIVIKSTDELKNFGYLEFWNWINAADSKKPSLRITYTTPYL